MTTIMMRRVRPRKRVVSFPRGLSALLALAVGATGCIGGRFATKPPGPVLDRPTHAIVERIAAVRAAAHLPAATWVAELGPTAARAATAVARGDQSLKSAARLAAQGGVTDLGRHVWSFAADCPDSRRFSPPPLVTQQPTLLYATAAVPGPAGHTAVILVIAEPGTSAIRADQMGGGRGGSNPILETYMHPSAATSPCGETWPPLPR